MFSSPAKGPILGLIGLLLLEIGVVAAKAMGLISLTGAAQAGFFVLILAGAAWLLPQYWRRIDEAARDAQKTAWFWGGSFGAAASLMVLTVMDKPWSPFASQLATLAPGELVHLGAVILAVGEVLGMTVVWAGWWWTRR